MTDARRVRFTRFSAPYHEGELAGFSPERARDLVKRGVAVFDPPDLDATHVAFAAMDRKELLAYAKEHLGVNEVPPDHVTDEEIRGVLRDASQTLADKGPEPSFDQLDSMDRPHLEAFAKTKLGLAEVDAVLTDDELRAQIRAMAEASLSFAPPPAVAPKAGKNR